MPNLIRNRAIVHDSWQLLEAAPSDVAALRGDLIVPLSVWQASRTELQAREGRTGVVVDGTDDPTILADALHTLPLIAVRFASFTDGRGYSIARLLRQRLGFAGELRAVGHVQRDQVAFMEQCGFDAFTLRDGEDANHALRAFADFSTAYQRTYGEPPVRAERFGLAHPAA